MKKYPAMALLEFQDIPGALFSTDKLLKKSPIAFVRCGTISQGRYLTLIGGTPASVDEAFQEGLFWGGDNVLDAVLMADVHPSLHDAILGRKSTPSTEALAILETATVASVVRAAELALKGTTVSLVELRLADPELAGKGMAIFQGELHDLEAAMEIVLARVDRHVSHRILSLPHDALNRRTAMPGPFAESRPLELEGETS